MMRHEWWVVYDMKGVALAAFPLHVMAEEFKSRSGKEVWTVSRASITFGSPLCPRGDDE